MGVLVTFEADGSARDGGGVTSADFGSPEDMVLGFGCTVTLSISCHIPSHTISYTFVQCPFSAKSMPHGSRCTGFPQEG